MVNTNNITSKYVTNYAQVTVFNFKARAYQAYRAGTQ